MFKHSFFFLALSLCAQTNVWTANYDLSRSNAILTESRLTTASVAPGQFGLLYSLPVDGQVYAQPLFASALDLGPQGTRDVVFVATMHNSVYAFDTTPQSAHDPLWKVSLGPTVPSANYSVEEYYTDIFPEVGILSTPVIDPASNSMYVVSANYSAGRYTYNLYALNITTGSVLQGPVEIQASVRGSAPDGVGGVLAFDPFWHIQRPALALSGGAVYIAFGSHGDMGDWHGWMVAYSAADISQRLAVFSSTPDGSYGSIWMSGRAPAVDDQGNLYVATANGDYDGARNFGESLLKLTPAPGLQVADWFTPGNYEALNDADEDFGSCGPVLVPGSTLLLAGGKDGVLYLLDSARLGKLAPGNPSVLQRFQAVGKGIFTMALWPRADSTIVYLQGFGEPVKSFRLAGGVLSTTPDSTGLQVSGLPFQGMTLSTSDPNASSAVLWTTTTEAGPAATLWPGVLHAYDASDLSNELWNSEMDPADRLPSFAKFVAPTVANGKVYVPTFSNQVAVYGLKSDGASALGSIDPVNAFSLQGGAVSPGELIAIRGTGIGPQAEVSYALSGDGSLPEELGGVRVYFDGQPAPLVSASANSVLAVVPYSVTGQASTQIELRYLGLSSAPRLMQVEPATPGLATVDGLGAGPGAFWNEDATANSPDNPALRGTVASILFTGAGTTTPRNDGLVLAGGSESFPIPDRPVTVVIGGIEVQPIYAGATPASLGAVLQLRVRIPDSAQPGPAVPFSVKVGDAASQPVTLAIQ